MLFLHGESRTRCYVKPLVSMVMLLCVVDYTESVSCDFEQHMCGYNVARRKTGAHWEIKHVGTCLKLRLNYTNTLQEEYALLTDFKVVL